MHSVFYFNNKYDPMLLPSGNPFKCHEEVWSLQCMIPPTKRLDIFPTDWGMLRRGQDAFRFFFKKYEIKESTFFRFLQTCVRYILRSTIEADKTFWCERGQGKQI